MKDDFEAFGKTYENLYQWVARCNDILVKTPGEYQDFASFVEKDGDKFKCDDSSEMKMQSNYKFMLQLKVNKKWKDWVYLARSDRCHAKYGLFAARDFSSNTMIGFFMGPIVWKAPVEGGYAPSAKELSKAGLIDSDYALQYRNKDCRWVVADPPSILLVDKKVIDGALLYMGMHYINNPCLDYTNGTSGYFKNRKEHNCLLMEDGCVKAIKKIKPGTELLTAYTTDQQREDEDGSKKPAAKKSVVKKLVGKKKKISSKKQAPKRSSSRIASMPKNTK